MTRTVSALLVFVASTLAQTDEIPPDTKIETTPSGLKYCVLKAGDGGEHPGMGSKVKVHYTGWLAANGKKFDSSLDRGEPTEFAIGQVIEGWNEGLALMTKGATFKFHIPAALGYGKRGFGGAIPPDADLIFVVELLDFKPGPKLPEFRTPDSKKAVTTSSGLEYEVVAPGKGEPYGKADTPAFHYTFWNTKGEFLGSSLLGGQPLQVRANSPRQFAFFKELCGLGLKEGSEIVCKVPPQILFGERPNGPKCPPNSVTIWRMKVESIKRALPLPEFVLPSGDDVVTTASGLKYQVLEPGEGQSPKASDVVTVHYAGWLTDGKLFDASFTRGDPTTFPLNRVIKGWTEGLQLMKPGAVYRFLIPADLAYGERGSPPAVPPNAPLVFHVELISVGR